MIGLIKVDLHVHTVYSNDCLTPPSDVLRWAKRRHLNALAVTDHNTIDGARELAAMSPLLVIIGEEIRTARGEIIGLFLQQAIPPGLSPLETVRCIHQQGGLVYVPHPADRLRRSTLEPEALAEIVNEVDLIEVLNARVTWSVDNQRAEELAREHRFLRGAGSDAHQGIEIGRAYLEMPAFTDAQGFLKALARAQICGRVSSPLVHMSSAYARLAKGLIAAVSLAK